MVAALQTRFQGNSSDSLDNPPSATPPVQASRIRAKGTKVQKSVPRKNATTTAEGEAGGRTMNTRASNKTAHPGQIVNDSKQKRRSPSEVQAAKNAKKADILAKLLADTHEREASAQRVAIEEDRLHNEDVARKQVAERPDLAMAEDLEENQLSVDEPSMESVIDDEGMDSVGYSSPLPDVDVVFDYHRGANTQHANNELGDDVVDVSDTQSEYVDEPMPVDSDDDIEVVGVTNRDSKAKASKTTSKKERGVVRANVAARRETQHPVVVGGKRKSHEKSLSASVNNQESGKRAKTVAVGGLREDWRANQKPHASNNSRAGASDSTTTAVNADDEDNIDNAGGEFDDEEPEAVLQVVRASKNARGTSAPTVNAPTKADISALKAGPPGIRNTSQVGLKITKPSATTAGHTAPRYANPATASSGKNIKVEPSKMASARLSNSVNADHHEAELETSVDHSSAPSASATHAKADSHAYTLHDLPFPQGAWSTYIKRWKVFRASLINWAGTLPDMFSAASHQDFAATVKLLWIDAFPELAAFAGQKVVIVTSGAALVDHRSAIGKAAVAAVAKLVPSGTSQKDTIDILSQHAVPDFIYRDPHAENGDRGSYLSKIILQVFALHMGVVLQASPRRAFGRPTGALALVCAALERAILGWKDGINEIEDTKKDKRLNKQNAFRGERWGPVTLRWHKGIEKNFTHLYTSFRYILYYKYSHNVIHGPL
ncbi:hypothetical protein AB1N83_007470 [Pleurotus pulmonarius]